MKAKTGGTTIHAIVAYMAAVLLAGASSAASAESRTYVRSWFGQAMASDDTDCPDGVNPPWSEQRLKDLVPLGYSQQQIDAFVKEEAVSGKKSGGKIEAIVTMRGRIDGKPVNPYSFPETVTDPKLHAAKARFAYGFNLDGKGAASPSGFEDPETHEKGVNNQLARALGCMREFRGSLTTNPLYWDWAWNELSDNEPAWLITLTGDDLSKDGPVTVTVDRALEHLRANTDGSPRRDSSYRIDPDPRSHNVFQGVMKNGVAVVDGPAMRMLQDPLVAMEFRLTKAHLRLTLQPDGSLEAIVGGYQPWADLYYSFAGGGSGNEDAATGDMPGIFYLFRKFADAAPDATGQNADISASYYIRAVPAFGVQAAPVAALLAKEAAR